MKLLRKLIATVALGCCTAVQAEPVMTLITVNTANPAGYSAWAKGNAEAISKANGAMAMGLCSPTSGADTSLSLCWKTRDITPGYTDFGVMCNEGVTGK